MKIDFIVDISRNSCDVYITPSKKWEDDTKLESLVKETYNGVSCDAALGAAIRNYANWINHGDVEITLGSR